MATDAAPLVTASQTAGHSTVLFAHCVDIRVRVEQALAEFVATEATELGAVDPALGPFVAVVREAVLNGGKRMRPTIAYWGWKGVMGGSEPVESVHPALASL